MVDNNWELFMHGDSESGWGWSFSPRKIVSVSLRNLACVMNWDGDMVFLCHTWGWLTVLGMIKETFPSCMGMVDSSNCWRQSVSQNKSGCVMHRVV